MPKLISRTSDPALSTEAGAHHYRIVGLEIAVAPAVPMSYVAVRLGDNSTSPDELPTDLILDRVYVHGSVLCHCKRGIMLNSRRTAVIDSYVSEIHAVGQDVQAIAGINGPGPFKIVNNYLEASTENVMFGGGSTGVPGLIPSDIEFRRNYVAKPLRWRSSIIPKPANVAARAGDAASLRGGHYYYAVVAMGPGDSVPNLRSDPSDEIEVRLSGGQNSVTLTWNPVTYGDSTDSRTATSYAVYRTSDAPSSKPRQWTGYPVAAAPTLSFTDTGAGGSQGPLRAGDWWQTKNLLELKNAQRMLVEANVMEYSWQQAQIGWAILMTPRVPENQYWAVVQDITFRNNIIRHAGGGATILGMDGECFRKGVSAQCVESARVLFQNNLFDDISRARWGGNGWMFIAQSSTDLTVDHNTAVTDSLCCFVGRAAGGQANINNTNLSVTNNIMFGTLSGSGASGGKALAQYAPNAVVTNNVMVGGDSAKFDRSSQNYFPAKAADVGFLKYEDGDYRLAAGSPYGKSKAKQSVGADIDSILAATAGVVSGTPGQAPSPEALPEHATRTR
jgi:hypothetical protein